MSAAFPFWIERASRWNKCFETESWEAFAGERASSKIRSSKEKVIYNVGDDSFEGYMIRTISFRVPEIMARFLS